MNSNEVLTLWHERWHLCCPHGSILPQDLPHGMSVMWQGIFFLIFKQIYNIYIIQSVIWKIDCAPNKGCFSFLMFDMSAKWVLLNPRAWMGIRTYCCIDKQTEHKWQHKTYLVLTHAYFLHKFCTRWAYFLTMTCVSHCKGNQQLWDFFNTWQNKIYSLSVAELSQCSQWSKI